MTTLANTVTAAIHLPRWVFPHLFHIEHRRRQATIDLIHSSPHLLRDIGATEGQISERRTQ